MIKQATHATAASVLRNIYLSQNKRKKTPNKSNHYIKAKRNYFEPYTKVRVKLIQTTQLSKQHNAL